MNEKNGNQVEFPLPEGLTIPDTISQNGEFEALATIKLKGGKVACLVALDGYRMSGYTEEDAMKDEVEDTEDGMTYEQAASEGMAEGY